MAPLGKRDAAASKISRQSQDEASQSTGGGNDGQQQQQRARPRSFFGALTGRASPSPSDNTTRTTSASSSTLSVPQAGPSQPRQSSARQPRRPTSLLSVAPSTRTITGLSTLSPAQASDASVSGQVNADSEHRGASNVTANGVNYGSLSAPSEASSGGALNRLKKMASNASIASTIRGKNNADGTAEGASALKKDAAVSAHANSSDKPMPEIAEEEGPAKFTDEASKDESDKPAKPNLSKRPSDGLGPPDAAKQARRKTWFGFQSSQDPAPVAEGPSQGETSKARETPDTKNEQPDERPQDANTQPVETSQDTAMPDAVADDGEAGTSEGKASSWLPWRAPSKPANQQSSELPSSYTDAVWRYVSWGSSAPTDSESNSAAKSQPANRGWLSWGATQPDGRPPSAMQGIETDTEEMNPPQAEVPTDEQEDHAVSKDAATNTQVHEGSTQEQPSFAARWIPYWSTGQPQADAVHTHRPSSELPTEAHDDAMAVETTTMTPAEQYKAESLARLGAKDAVINTATRSAWLNYFGNRRTAAPPARMKESIDEPEIMKLDLRDKDTPTETKAKKSQQSKLTSSGVNSSQSSLKECNRPTAAKGAASSKSARDDLKKGTKQLDAKKGLADPAPPTSRPVTPLTSDRKVAANMSNGDKSTDSAQSTKLGKGSKGPAAPRANLLLPTFEDVFSREPRNLRPRQGVFEKTISYFFSDPNRSATDAHGKAREDVKLDEAQFRLPRHYNVLGHRDLAATRGCKPIRKVTVIGVHGWFSTGPLRNIFGEPTGTSIKFSTMMRNEVLKHFEEAGHPLGEDSITSIALEADGKVSDRVDKSFSRLISNPKWVNDILTSDAIFIAAHSQGSIVATHLLARLIEQRHIDAQRSKVMLLCMCGIHNGPFHHLRSTMTSYYMSAFETPAARELFDFQDRKSPVSQLYAASLRIIVSAGVKLVYVASLDDQVVPLYSALHTSASHPSILRAIFCDGAAFPRVDFLTNLLSFCTNVRNAGLHDHHLTTLLSSSVAGSLYGGAGHSLVYEEPQVYALAVRYLLEVSSPAHYPTTRTSSTGAAAVDAGKSSRATGVPGMPPLVLDAAEGAGDVQETAKRNSNPYTLPWSLRGLLEDDKVRHFFADDIRKLVRDYEAWAPTTKTLRDVQFRLEPLRMVSSTSSTRASTPASSSTTNKTNSKL